MNAYVFIATYSWLHPSEEGQDHHKGVQIHGSREDSFKTVERPG